MKRLCAERKKAACASCLHDNSSLCYDSFCWTYRTRRHQLLLHLQVPTDLWLTGQWHNDLLVVEKMSSVLFWKIDKFLNSEELGLVAQKRRSARKKDPGRCSFSLAACCCRHSPLTENSKKNFLKRCWCARKNKTKKRFVDSGPYETGLTRVS